MPTHPLDIETMPDSAMLAEADVRALLRVSRSTLWRWVKAGVIPPPLKFVRASRFRVGDVRAALSSRQRGGVEK